jgi:hypothetical protein
MSGETAAISDPYPDNSSYADANAHLSFETGVCFISCDVVVFAWVGARPPTQLRYLRLHYAQRIINNYHQLVDMP